MELQLPLATTLLGVGQDEASQFGKQRPEDRRALLVEQRLARLLGLSQPLADIVGRDASPARLAPLSVADLAWLREYAQGVDLAFRSCETVAIARKPLKVLEEIIGLIDAAIRESARFIERSHNRRRVDCRKGRRGEISIFDAVPVLVKGDRQSAQVAEVQPEEVGPQEDALQGGLLEEAIDVVAPMLLESY